MSEKAKKSKWLPKIHGLDPALLCYHWLEGWHGHLILHTDHGVYRRVASTKTEPVNFIEWPENESCDILAEDQQSIFQAHKADPANHKLPATYHEDMVWSVGQLIAGPPRWPLRTRTWQVAPSILLREQFEQRRRKWCMCFRPGKEVDQQWLIWILPSPQRQPGLPEAMPRVFRKPSECQQSLPTHRHNQWTPFRT